MFETSFVMRDAIPFLLIARGVGGDHLSRFAVRSLRADKLVLVSRFRFARPLGLNADVISILSIAPEYHSSIKTAATSLPPLP